MKRTMISVAMVLVLMLTMVATVAMAATFPIDTVVPSGFKDICRLVEVYGGQEINWNLNFEAPIEGCVLVFSEKTKTLLYEQDFNSGNVQGSFTAKAHDDNYMIRIVNENCWETHVTGQVELPGY